LLARRWLAPQVIARIDDKGGTDVTSAEADILPEHTVRVEQAFLDLEKGDEDGRWQQLDAYYANFRERFGPKALGDLEGVALLERMHKREGQDCLMYWLEFKNDDEFPALFGSIRGGSALKFGVYQSAKTGQWMRFSSEQRAGAPVPEDAAIEFATLQRDQLVAGCKALSELPDNASDEQYVELQQLMDEHITEAGGWSWGHKYFHLMFPNKLDDFHNEDFQRFYLVKLLQEPPAQKGRYVCAGRYVALTREFGRPMAQLTWALQEAFGHPQSCWRLDASKLPVTGAADLMRSSDVVALPWGETGDISDIKFSRPGKDELRGRIDAIDLKGVNAYDATQDVFSLALNVDEGDTIVVTEGEKGVAIGIVSGGYQYDVGSPLAHQRPVDWLDLGEWECPELKQWARALSYYSNPSDRLVVEQRLLHPEIPPVGPVIKPGLARLLSGREGHIQSVLERKGQVILYGPPGTGKTYWAQHGAEAILAKQLYSKAVDDLAADERAGVARHIRLCTFHPAYGYEDFLEGYRPEERDGRLVFALRDGVFKALCEEAAAHPQERFVLIIDEINRGDVPRIFGELLTVLEKDKRGREVHLPLSGQPFAVPPNVAVIGTMNTADRSIALLDTALRRRFGFIELMPEPELLAGVMVDGIPLEAWLAALNSKIVEKRGADGRNLQVGHAYLLEKGSPVATLAGLARIVRDDIVPLLQEYCYEDYRMLADILGREFVDAEAQRLRVELFREEKREELKQALLAMDPNMATSAEAVEAEVEAPEDPEGDAEEGDARPSGVSEAPVLPAEPGQ
jgi:5-methylcytosine-specific restriction protein B